MLPAQTGKSADWNGLFEICLNENWLDRGLPQGDNVPSRKLNDA
jgi:hypothetical protein